MDDGMHNPCCKEVAEKGVAEMEDVPDLSRAVDAGRVVRQGLCPMYEANWMGLDVHIKVLNCLPANGDGSSGSELAAAAFLSDCWKLRHPSIVATITLAKVRGQQAVAAEPARECDSLGERVSTRPASLHLCCEVLRDVSAALRYMHAKRCEHGTLSVDTVYLSDGRARLSLLDRCCHTAEMRDLNPASGMGETNGGITRRTNDIVAFGKLGSSLLQQVVLVGGASVNGRATSTLHPGSSGPASSDGETSAQLNSLCEQCQRTDAAQRPSMAEVHDLMKAIAERCEKGQSMRDGDAHSSDVVTSNLTQLLTEVHSLQRMRHEATTRDKDRDEAIDRLRRSMSSSTSAAAVSTDDAKARKLAEMVSSNQQEILTQLHDLKSSNDYLVTCLRSLAEQQSEASSTQATLVTQQRAMSRQMTMFASSQQMATTCLNEMSANSESTASALRLLHTKIGTPAKGSLTEPQFAAVGPTLSDATPFPARRSLMPGRHDQWVKALMPTASTECSPSPPGAAPAPAHDRHKEQAEGVTGNAAETQQHEAQQQQETQQHEAMDCRSRSAESQPVRSAFTPPTQHHHGHRQHQQQALPTGAMVSPNTSAVASVSSSNTSHTAVASFSRPPSTTKPTTSHFTYSRAHHHQEQQLQQDKQLEMRRKPQQHQRHHYQQQRHHQQQRHYQHQQQQQQQQQPESRQQPTPPVRLPQPTTRPPFINLTTAASGPPIASPHAAQSSSVTTFTADQRASSCRSAPPTMSATTSVPSHRSSEQRSPEAKHQPRTPLPTYSETVSGTQSSVTAAENTHTPSSASATTPTATEGEATSMTLVGDDRDSIDHMSPTAPDGYEYLDDFGDEFECGDSMRDIPPLAPSSSMSQPAKLSQGQSSSAYSLPDHGQSGMNSGGSQQHDGSSTDGSNASSSPHGATATSMSSSAAATTTGPGPRYSEGDSISAASGQSPSRVATGNGKPPTRKRPVFPLNVTQVFKDWLHEHYDNPYPSEGDKKLMVEQTKLTMQQVDYWFVNARRRLVQPMRDEAARQGKAIVCVDMVRNRRRVTKYGTGRGGRRSRSPPRLAPPEHAYLTDQQMSQHQAAYAQMGGAIAGHYMPAQSSPIAQQQHHHEQQHHHSGWRHNSHSSHDDGYDEAHNHQSHHRRGHMEHSDGDGGRRHGPLPPSQMPPPGHEYHPPQHHHHRRKRSRSRSPLQNDMRSPVYPYPGPQTQ